MSIRIYGAGMAGLLTATMMRRYRPLVYEAQPELPNNHGALLRFRSTAVSEATGLPLRTVRVTKAVKTERGLRDSVTIRDANRYSYKVAGEILERSVMDLAPVTRYIAPDDFLSAMARDAILNVNMPLTLERLRQHHDDGDETVSTIPMPILMDIVEWPNKPDFRWRPVWSMALRLPMRINVFQTIYYPGPEPYYRASITGDKVIVEYMKEPTALAQVELFQVLDDFGINLVGDGAITSIKRQEYGKLMPLEDRQREEFMLAMTDTYALYSVGRFATWRQILLDDVVSDIRKVDSWITRRSGYARRLEMTS